MKRKEMPLTPHQQKMVEQNLSVVHWVIVQNIHINEHIYGFGYDDLYQEGCIWLCRAAVTYQEKYALFSTYASKVVRNGLIYYCRQLCKRQQRFSYLTVGEHGELYSDGHVLEQSDFFTEQINLLEIMELLENSKKSYQGVARLGIEALELRIKGLCISEIAELYGVPPTHIGAWISRSAQKLKKDVGFLSGIQ